MKTIISIIVIMFAVGCSDRDMEIYNLTDANKKLKEKHQKSYKKLEAENKKLKTQVDTAVTNAQIAKAKERQYERKWKTAAEDASTKAGNIAQLNSQLKGLQEQIKILKNK